jgi:hypothetical protein
MACVPKGSAGRHQDTGAWGQGVGSVRHAVRATRVGHGNGARSQAQAHPGDVNGSTANSGQRNDRRRHRDWAPEWSREGGIDATT